MLNYKRQNSVRDDTRSPLGATPSRRDLLRYAGLGVATALVPKMSYGREEEFPKTRDQLLDEIERRACRYFYDCAHPSTGLVLDRARIQGREDRRTASIAATGFGLSALCIANARGYLNEYAAQERVERTLDFLARRAYRKKGFYYHFVDVETGKRDLNSEISSVDTTWLLCGVIQAREHFNTPQISKLADDIIGRVEWDWMWAGGPTLCHGWTPEQKFLPYRWDRYCELLTMYLLAIGAAHHSIPLSAWDAWQRPMRFADSGDIFVASTAPLFAHQYSHAWVDFRNRWDGYTDYFRNSRLATMKHRDFCISLRDRFPWFGENMWGITACDSRHGYTDWGGAETEFNSKIDGTLAPCAAGGSLVFLPEECGRVLETMLERYGKKVWNQYGFVDAFQAEADWWASDVIGIDLGIVLLMAENLRNQSVWKTMMAAPEIKRGFETVGFYDLTPA